MPRYQPADSVVSPRFVGVPTFARLPLVDTLEDVDLEVVGVPFDTGVTFRVGGRFGPNAVRAASLLLRRYNPALDVMPFEVLSCVDRGDISIVPGFTERSYQAIERYVAPLADAGVVPLLLGGDHSIEVGLRGSLYDPTDWTSLRDELGLDYLTTRKVLAIGPEETAARIRERVAGRRAFISFDIDVIDPAFAPGTGTPEAGGLSSAQGLEIVRGLTGIDFVGFDVVEVIPGYDPGGVTATLAANLAYEMVSLAALRRLRREGQGT